MERQTADARRSADPLGLVLGRYLLTGDEGAIEEVVRETRPRLLAVAARIAGRDDAEDAVQTAFLSLVRRRGAPLDAPVIPWLVTAVVRSAYRKRAAARRDQRLADRLAMEPDDAPPTEDGAGREEIARLRSAVDRLPSRYRDPVVLHDLHGLSTFEVARLLDLSEAGVRTRLHRARSLVRERMLPRLVASILALPFIVVDRARDVGLGGTLGIGGLMNVPTVAVIAVVAVAAGILVGQKVLTSEGALEERVEKAEADVKRLSGDVERLTKERDDAKTRAELAKSALAAAPSRPAPAHAEPPAPTPAPAMTDLAASAKPDASRRIVVAGFEPVIESVDWGKVGNSLKEMTPLMPKFGEEWARTGKIPLELAGQVSELNSVLVRAAIAAANRMGLGIDRVNSAYTHPSFMVNAMAAALESAGKPLSAEQMKSLADVAARYATADADRERAYTEKTWALKKLIDESELKDRFFADAFAVLTPEQRDLLVAPDTKGRLQLDLFSSGLIWIQHAQVLRVADAGEAVTKIESGLMNLLGWGDDKRATMHPLAVEAVNALPRDLLTETPDGLSKLGMIPVTRVVEAARRQITLLERLISEARLDDAQVKAMSQVSIVMVPLHVLKDEPTVPR